MEDKFEFDGAHLKNECQKKRKKRGVTFAHVRTYVCMYKLPLVISLGKMIWPY